jgi:hypothetical protein
MRYVVRFDHALSPRHDRAGQPVAFGDDVTVEQVEVGVDGHRTAPRGSAAAEA